jgi:hypothetical protein
MYGWVRCELLGVGKSMGGCDLNLCGVGNYEWV